MTSLSRCVTMQTCQKADSEKSSSPYKSRPHLTRRRKDNRVKQEVFRHHKRGKETFVVGIWDLLGNKQNCTLCCQPPSARIWYKQWQHKSVRIRALADVEDKQYRNNCMLYKSEEILIFQQWHYLFKRLVSDEMLETWCWTEKGPLKEGEASVNKDSVMSLTLIRRLARPDGDRPQFDKQKQN